MGSKMVLIEMSSVVPTFLFDFYTHYRPILQTDDRDSDRNKKEKNLLFKLFVKICIPDDTSANVLCIQGPKRSGYV